MKFQLLFLTTCFFLITYACQKEPMNPAIGQVDCNTVSYSNVIKPLFDRTCGGSSCHGKNASDGEITNYQQTKRYVDNGEIKKTVLDTREMPIGMQLTGEELAQVKCWLDNGALNN